jgi:phytoene dehydrogenase-like protein
MGGMCSAAWLASAGLKVAVLERSGHLGGRASHRVRRDSIVTTGAIMIPTGPGSAIRQAFDAVGAEMNMVDTTGRMRYRLAHGDYTAALMGVGIHEMGAGTFFQFLKGSSKGSRFGLATEGNGELMATLAGGLENHGATILRRTQVNEIVVEDNCVVGVRVITASKERIIRADYILSNTGPDRTVELAGGDDAFESSYIARLRTDDHAATIFHVSFLMDRPLIEDLDGSLVFGNNTNLIYLEIPSNISPHIAPPGRHPHTAYGAPVDSANVDYQGELDNTIAELEHHFPGVLEEAEFVVKAMHRGRSPGMHRWVGRAMPVTTSIRGLYNVGDGCTAPGTIGTEGAASSAKLATSHLLERHRR